MLCYQGEEHSQCGQLHFRLRLVYCCFVYVVVFCRPACDVGTPRAPLICHSLGSRQAAGRHAVSPPANCPPSPQPAGTPSLPLSSKSPCQTPALAMITVSSNISGLLYRLRLRLRLRLQQRLRLGLHFM